MLNFQPIRARLTGLPNSYEANVLNSATANKSWSHKLPNLLAKATRTSFTSTPEQYRLCSNQRRCDATRAHTEMLFPFMKQYFNVAHSLWLQETLSSWINAGYDIVYYLTDAMTTVSSAKLTLDSGTYNNARNNRPEYNSRLDYAFLAGTRTSVTKPSSCRQKRCISQKNKLGSSLE